MGKRAERTAPRTGRGVLWCGGGREEPTAGYRTRNAVMFPEGPVPCWRDSVRDTGRGGPCRVHTLLGVCPKRSNLPALGRNTQNTNSERARARVQL